MPSPSPMNAKAQEELRQLEKDQPGVTSDLIRMFLNDAPKQLERIEAGYAARDPESMRQSAHYLRSGALVLGLTALCDKCRVAEHVDPGEYGDTGTDLLVAGLRAELEPLLVTLAELVEEA